MVYIQQSYLGEDNTDEWIPKFFCSPHSASGVLCHPRDGSSLALFFEQHDWISRQRGYVL